MGLWPNLTGTLLLAALYYEEFSPLRAFCLACVCVRQVSEPLCGSAHDRGMHRRGRPGVILLLLFQPGCQALSPMSLTHHFLLCPYIWNEKCKGIRQPKSKRAISPQRRTVCSLLVLALLKSPLWASLIHPTLLKGKSERQRRSEQWGISLLHSPPPSPTIPDPLGPRMTPSFIKLQVLLRRMSKWLHVQTDLYQLLRKMRSGTEQLLVWGQNQRVPLSAGGM